MRKDTLFLATPLIGGAFGLFLRWLQRSVIFDAETGLAARSSGISWALIAYCAVYAFVCFIGVWKRDTPRFAVGHTVFGGGRALRTICAIMGGLTVLGGILIALFARITHTENLVLWLIFALLVVGAALAFWASLAIGTSISRPAVIRRSAYSSITTTIYGI